MQNICSPDVSVCLLCYNHVNTLESTIASVLNQTVAGYELIISDDRSTDGSWELLQQLQSVSPRIRIIRTPRNLGMAGNANYAMRHASRPYVALLHHDDIYRPDLLEKWAGVLVRHPDAAFVFNAYAILSSDLIYQERSLGERTDGAQFLAQYLLPRWGCPVRGTVMLRHDAWLRVGGMREQFGLLADVDLWMRLCRIGSVGYVPEPLITVRQVRPSYYPEIYREDTWSWLRQRLLYEIHATNRLESLDLHSPSGRLEWLRFRLRVSSETAKWLAYALIRRKWAMLASSKGSRTPYDLWPLRLFRWIVSWVARHI